MISHTRSRAPAGLLPGVCITWPQGTTRLCGTNKRWFGFRFQAWWKTTAVLAVLVIASLHATVVVAYIHTATPRGVPGECFSCLVAQYIGTSHGWPPHCYPGRSTPLPFRTSWGPPSTRSFAAARGWITTNKPQVLTPHILCHITRTRYLRTVHYLSHYTTVLKVRFANDIAAKLSST